MEKALPSGSRKANMAGTPGQRRISSASTPAARRAAWAASASSVVNRMPMAPRVTSVAAGFKRDDGVVAAGREFDPSAAVGGRVVAQDGEAEGVAVEPQGSVLIGDRDADRANAGDVGLRGGHQVLLRVCVAERAADVDLEHLLHVGLQVAFEVSEAIAAGADPGDRGQARSETPLHWAASSDDAEVAEALIDAGADVHGPQGSIGTPLANAIGYACCRSPRNTAAARHPVQALTEHRYPPPGHAERLDDHGAAESSPAPSS